MAPQKVALAVDPYNTKPAQFKSSLDFARKVAQDLHGETEAVYALGPSQYFVPSEFAALPVNVPWQELKASAEESFSNLVQETKIKTPQILQIVKSRGFSVAAEIKTLDRYLTNHGYEYIVVASHGYKGLKRFFIGSFAETAMRSMKTPMFILNPKARLNPDGIRRIAFATDSSADSRKAFNRLIKLARNLGCTVDILSILPEPKHLTNPQLNLWLREYSVSVGEELKKWVSFAKKEKVEASYRIVPGKGKLADNLAAYAAKTKADVIALAALSAAAPLTAITGLSNQLVRRSSLPLLVLHP